MSSIVLGPAQTVIIPDSLIADRSAETSKLSETSLWTPPIPPVTNTEIEASLHILREPDTVVPPGFFKNRVL